MKMMNVLSVLNNTGLHKLEMDVMLKRERDKLQIRRFRKENWVHMWVRMACVVNSCQGKDAGVLF